MARTLMLALITCLCACGGDDGSDPDTGTDAGVDTAGDTGPDTETDAGVDTVGDTGADEVMDAVDDEAEGGCSGRACPSEGNLQCTGQIIERCATGDDGCLVWHDHIDCGSAGGECNDVGNGCDIPCTAMEEDFLICLGDLVLSCNPPLYEVFQDCSESEQTCRLVATGVAICE